MTPARRETDNDPVKSILSVMRSAKAVGIIGGSTLAGFGAACAIVWQLLAMPRIDAQIDVKVAPMNIAVDEIKDAVRYQACQLSVTLDSSQALRADEMYQRMKTRPKYLGAR